MIVKIVMCEGPHDAAFICRILRGMGCGNDKRQIGEFPENLKNFLLKQYNPDVESFPIYNVRGKMINPNYGLNYKDEVLFLLYGIGGDSKKDIRVKIIDSFLSLFGTEMATNAQLGFDLHFVYEFDADNKGRDYRLQQINTEIRGIMPDFPGIDEGSYCSHKKISWGAYIFAAPGDDTGKLEDIVLPLMRENNGDLFDEIEKIADKREAYALYCNHKKKMDDDNWNKDKAMIGMAGQLHKCGSANVAIIEQSCLIEKDQLLKNKSCVELGLYLLQGSSFILPAITTD